MTAPHSLGNEPELGLRQVPITQVDHGNNPRSDFESTDMAGLTASIKENGVLSPIRVTVHKEGDTERYVVVYGHRRLEAAKAAKLPTIPAIVAEASDQDFIASLVENVQRQDLSALEEAQAYHNLREAGMKVTEIARRVGKSQPHISNMLRLLNLPDEIQARVRSGDLSAAHAKNIVSLPAARQKEIAQRIVDEGMTVREVEVELMSQRRKEDEAKEAKATEKQRAEEFAAAVTELQQVYKRNGWKKAQDVVFQSNYQLDSEAITTQMKADGFRGFRRLEYATMATEPRWDCGCTAVLLSTQRAHDDNPKVCIVPAHKDEWEAQREAEATLEREAAFKRFDAQRRKVSQAMREGSKGLLTVNGQRIMLYAYYRLLVKYGGTTKAVNDLQLRHGGPETTTFNLQDDYGPIWETISGMNEADLGEELVEAALSMAMINTYGDGSRYTINIDRGFRQWLVDTLKVDEDYVWGKHEPVASASDAQPTPDEEEDEELDEADEADDDISEEEVDPEAE